LLLEFFNALFQLSNIAILFRQSQIALMQLVLQALYLRLQDRVLGTQPVMFIAIHVHDEKLTHD